MNLCLQGSGNLRHKFAQIVWFLNGLLMFYQTFGVNLSFNADMVCLFLEGLVPVRLLGTALLLGHIWYIIYKLKVIVNMFQQVHKQYKTITNIMFNISTHTNLHKIHNILFKHE